MVDRYDDGPDYMDKDPDGWWVEYDDYQKLEAEVERLREALLAVQNYQQNAVGDLYPAEILVDITKIAKEALKGGSDE